MAKICGFEIESWGEKSEEGRTGFLSLWARLFILSGPCADVIRPVSLFTKSSYEDLYGQEMNMMINLLNSFL